MAKVHTGTPAQRLRAKIAARGWSQAHLAKVLGTDAGVVCRWLSGEVTPSLEMACRIADVLGIPVEAWRKPRAA